MYSHEYEYYSQYDEERALGEFLGVMLEPSGEHV
jgi:hypothetical protein